MMVYLNGSCARNSYQNDLMVEKLREKKILKTPCISNVMKSVSRRFFCPGVPRQFAFADSSVSIGYAARMSAPSHHASALELLRCFLPQGGRALDVGSGSGYMTTCLAILAGSEGLVIGVDHVKYLTQQATRNVYLLEYPRYLYENFNLQFITADGRLGWLPDAPYDVIYVGAAYETVPSPLLRQLKLGGRLVIPLGTQGSEQQLYHFDKHMNGDITGHAVMDVFFEPLTDLCQQCPVIAHT